MRKLILAVLLPCLLAPKQVLANDDSIRLLCIDTKGVMEPTYITLNLQRGSYMEEDDVLGDDCAVMSEVFPEELTKHQICKDSTGNFIISTFVANRKTGVLVENVTFSEKGQDEKPVRRTVWNCDNLDNMPNKF